MQRDFDFFASSSTFLTSATRGGLVCESRRSVLLDVVCSCVRRLVRRLLLGVGVTVCGVAFLCERVDVTGQTCGAFPSLPT